MPLKRIERDIDNPVSRYYRLFHGSWPERVVLSALMPWHAVRPDLVIATSEETREIVSRAFGLAEDHVVITGNPRNDRLLDGAGSGLPVSLPTRIRDASAEDQKLVVYLPTFRDNGSSFMGFDWPRLDATLAAAGLHLLIKFHPLDRTEIHGSFEHIDTLQRDIEIYDLLPHTTALISDYSSVIWDYMLLRRPIIYYVPDLEDFVADCRGMLFELRDIAVGPVCEDFDALLAAILALGHASDTGRPGNEHSNAVMQRLHRYSDARSSERVLKALTLSFPEVRAAIQRGDTATTLEGST